jgi:L-threonylcarbamoyladenylate synthase
MGIEKNKLINIDEDPDAAIILASELFHSSKVFIYPTDTIYGIGGNPFDENVIDRIAELKSRDETKKFIWLLSDFERVMSYAEIIFEDHLEFLHKIWPAPITVIVNLNKRTSEIIRQKTAAIRVPQNAFCLKLLNEISRPLISTSVNRSGAEPITKIDDIISNFSRNVDAILFNSNPIESRSSTIIDLTSKKPKLIREGSIKFVELLQYFS